MTVHDTPNRAAARSAVIPEAEVQALVAEVRGVVLTPGDEDYDTARQVWNAMVDKYPGLIVRCSGVADVLNAVAFARAHHLVVAVRGGGHNVAGNATCDGGMVPGVIGELRLAGLDQRSQFVAKHGP